MGCQQGPTGAFVVGLMDRARNIQYLQEGSICHHLAQSGWKSAAIPTALLCSGIQVRMLDLQFPGGFVAAVEQGPRGALTKGSISQPGAPCPDSNTSEREVTGVAPTQQCSQTSGSLRKGLEQQQSQQLQNCLLCGTGTASTSQVCGHSNQQQGVKQSGSEQQPLRAGGTTEPLGQLASPWKEQVQQGAGAVPATGQRGSTISKLLASPPLGRASG